MESYCESRSRWICVALTACLTLFLTPCSSSAKDEKKEKGKGAAEFDLASFSRERFERIKDSTSLEYDWEAILNFVSHAGGDVLGDLISAYLKPPAQPELQLRQLLASGIRLRYISEHIRSGGKLSEADAARLVTFATQDCLDTSHAWAAYNAFRALSSGEQVFVDAVKEQAEAAATPFLRATALEALGRRHDRDLLGFFDATLGGALDEEDGTARALLVESLAWAIANTCAVSRQNPTPAELIRRSRDKKASGPAARPEDLERLRPLIDLLDDGPILARTRRQVELAIEHALGNRGLFDETESWRRALGKEAKPPEPEEAEKPRQGRTTVVQKQVSFIGIETTGERIIFVLDASDSMLKPLRHAEKEALRKLIENDRPQKEESVADAKKRRRGRTVVERSSRKRTAFSTDWQSVKTRFDAARAHLKHTLSKMDPATYFAVVLFGDKAELLRRTPRFVKGTEKARMLVARELDAIKPGPKGQRFPHGRLRGQTNLYGAFDLAFRVTTRGLIKKNDAYVNTDLLTKGADAIFLLSDGQPTVDGFRGWGPLFRGEGYWIGPIPPSEYTVTDPETGAKRTIKTGGSPRRFVPASKQKTKYEQGPYVKPHALVDDIRRRNLFVRAVIHVVGIGEADYDLLERLSKSGHGQWIQIGDER